MGVNRWIGTEGIGGCFFYLHRRCQPRPTLLHTHGAFSNFEFVNNLTNKSVYDNIAVL